MVPGEDERDSKGAAVGQQHVGHVADADTPRVRNALAISSFDWHR